MKRLRIGRRRTQASTSSPLELALSAALENGSWRVPDRFNLTRDLVDVLGRYTKRQALTILGIDGIVEPRTFKQISEGGARWAHILRSKGIGQGDRVLVLSRLNEDWVDIALGCLKIGAVFAPVAPTIGPQALESRVAVTDAALVVAGEESEDAIARMSFTPEVHHVKSGRMRRSSDIPLDEPTADTSSRDVAFLVWTAGTEGDPKPVAHTHGSLFAARVLAEHWLDAREGDLVWCAAAPSSALAVTTTLAGPWTAGAEVVIHEGDFSPAERLDLIRRVGPSILCQSPAEYEALAGLRQLPRSRPPRLRRLLTTGDYLEPDVLERFHEAWGLAIHPGYGQAEIGVVTLTADAEDGTPPAAGEIGAPLTGHHLAVVDDQGNELPPGVEGDLAVRGRPPTLFAGYWESPDETKRAFRGDWYVTGDVAAEGESGLKFLARSGELITARGRTFGPHEVERALGGHAAVAESAVVGVHDLERGGQFVRGFVVLEKGIEGTEQLEAELRQFVSESVAEQQVPREIEFVDTLPRSSSGAIRRLELRDRPMSGRPLWEAPPTSEPEPEPPTTSELLVATEPEPAVDEPAPPEPAVEAAAVAAVASFVDLEPEAPPPTIEPESQPEPEAVAAPEPPADPKPPPAPAEAEFVVAPDTSSPAPVEVGTPPVPPPSRAEAAVDTEPTLQPAEPPEPKLPVGGAAPAEPASPAADVDPEPTEEQQTSSAAAETPPTPTLDGPPAAPAADAAPVEIADVEDAAPHASEPSVVPPAPVDDEPRHLPEFPEIVELEHTEAPSGPARPSPLTQEERADTAPDEPASPATSPDAPALGPSGLAVVGPGPAAKKGPTAPTPAPPSPDPLPDYIASTADAYAAISPAPPESALEPEPEEQDFGPLPEYVVDPGRRLEVVGEPEAPEQAPVVEPEPAVDPSFEDHPLAGLARPQVSIPIPADDDATAPKSRPAERKPPNRGRATPADTRKRKRERSTGDPGDEGLETGWMQRLSSRLDAYGMSEQGEGTTDETPEAPDDSEAR